MTTPDTPMVILINRRCGHIASIANLAMATHMQTHLDTLRQTGHRGWGIEIRPATDHELNGILAGTRCARCRFD